MAGEIKTLCGKTLHDIVARMKITELFQKIASLEKNGVGKPGKDGVGIESVDQTTTSTTDGGINIVTVKKTDGSSSTFEVRNGSKGSKGDTGATGPQGPKGDTGSQGVQGIQGETGPKGNDGTSVTITSVTQSNASGGYSIVTFSDGKELKIKNGDDVLLYEYLQESGFTGTQEEMYFGLADSASAIWHATMTEGKGEAFITKVTLDKDDGLGSYLGKATLPSDLEKIIVEFDNAYYICNITKSTYGVRFGNAHVHDSTKEDTGEPFYVIETNKMFTAYLEDKTSTHTMGLYDFGLTYNKLPKDFLPDDIGTGDGFSPTVEVEEINGGHKISVTDVNGTSSFNVMDGVKGDTGSKGETGVGIASVKQTTTSTADGGANIVTVTKTDGTKETFQVLNGSKGSTGAKGNDGYTPVKGVDYFDGVDGKDGYTPQKGVDYFDGSKGDKGDDGTSVTVKSVSESGADGGNNVVTFSDGKTLTVKNGSKGSQGNPGAAGTSVTVSNVSESNADGGSNVVTFSDGKKITIKNGSKGSTGEKGDKGDSITGPRGPKGDTGSKGDTGVGIASVKQTVTSTADSGINEIEVTLTDGTKSTLKIRNGSGTGFPAYDYAQEAGFTGTPEEFYMGLADSAGAVWHANMIKGKGDLLLTATSIYDDGLGASLGKATLPTDMEEIIVDFDNVSYICKITKETNGVSFGNANIYSSSKPNTNEPFYIKSLNNSFMVYLRDKSARPTISLYDFGLSYNKLPKEFLPDDIPTSGGCSADWSQNNENGAGYVKNRTHWVERAEKNVFPLTNVTFADNQSSTLGVVIDFVPGEVYTVNFNGTEYTCTAVETTYQGFPVFGVGNGALFGTTDLATDDPFLIASAPSMSMTLFINALGLTTVPIEIVGVKETIHKLDNKFIDANWLAKMDYVEETIIESQEVSWMFETNVLPNDIVIGRKSKVVFDDVEYVCTNTFFLTDNEEILAIGNAVLLNDLIGTSFPDTGEPFVITSINGGLLNAVVINDDSTHTISLTIEKASYNKMPKEYMPDIEMSDLVKSYTLSGYSISKDPSSSECEEALKVLRNGGNVFMDDEMYPVIFISKGINNEYYILFFDANRRITLLNTSYNPETSSSDNYRRIMQIPLVPQSYPINYSVGMAFSDMYKVEAEVGDVVVVKEARPLNGTAPGMPLDFETTNEPVFKSVILKSTTEGSTKKFKITVDDSGTISATEVTE